MLFNRVIPCLLIEDENLVKTKKFKDPVYVGDPINAVKVFNDKEVDEIIILDISKSTSIHGPNFELIESIASECFMPLAYGGGIRSMEHISQLTSLGVEKIVLNTVLNKDPELVKRAVARFGSQAIIAGVDIKKDFFYRQRVFINGGKEKINTNVISYCQQIEQLGVGEIFLTSIDSEGCENGYDFKLIKEVSSVVGVPLVANGGARNLDDILNVTMNYGASAAAGSMFVFFGPHKAVLISYPSPNDIKNIFK